MTADPIYVDHNATTPLLAEVVQAMLPYLREHYGNPSSGHVYGLRAREAVERARAQVAALLGASPEEIVFTSGGTESNNLAIRGATAARPERRHVVTSAVEHPAVSAPCRALAREGYTVLSLPVDERGCVRPADVEGVLREDTALLTVMHANNETGAIQPVAELARSAHACGAVVHSDAAQSVGKIPVRADDLGVDLLTVAGHKLYAPKGVGALYVRRGTEIRPFLLGAGHERGLRPGTENVAAVVGLGAACEIAHRSLASELDRVRALRDRLWDLLAAGVPGLALNGPTDRRLPNTLNVRFPRVSGPALLAAVPGIAASTGAACHEGGDQASAVIRAMGIEEREALGSVRLSLGRGTTRAEIEEAAGLLTEGWRRLAEGGVRS